MKQQSPNSNSAQTLPRKNSKGAYIQQYVGGKYHNQDPIQQKLDRFIRAFQHICLKFQTSIDRQNFKISNIENTLVQTLSLKLDKLVGIGQKIEQGIDKSLRIKIKNMGNQKSSSKPQKDEKNMTNRSEKQRQKEKYNLQNNYLKQNIIDMGNIDNKPLIKAFPPLPTLEKCYSPSSPNNQKKSMFSDDFALENQKKFVQFEENQSLQSPEYSMIISPQQQKSEINKWVGQFYNSAAASYFDLYSKGKINYEDMKIRFSYQILDQSLNTYNKWLDQYKNKYSTEQLAIKRPQFYHSLNQSSRKILEFLISKYPPSRRKKIDTQLSDKIKSTSNKFSVIKYDILNNAKMNIGMIEKQTDFTKEIKTWLNILVTESKKQFPIFKMQMQDIFTNTDGSIDGSKRMDAELQFLIGSKISEGTTLFTPEQLEAPGLQIKSTQLLRILMKWCQQLLSYFTNPQDKIYGNTSGFKTVRGALPIKIPKSRLDQLASKLKNIYEKQILPELKVEDNNVGYLVTDLLKMVSQGVQNYQFLNERQISIVKLAQYLNESLKAHVLKFLNLVLSRLVKIRSKYEDQRLESNLHLITFNVMDLLRCRCVGSKSQIYRIFKKISESQYFEIIRVKNKLNEPTRDILINLKIKNSFLICEVQLSLGEAQEQVNDHFCHFLYELQRTNFGVLFESASQICNLDPRMHYVYTHKEIQFKGVPQKKLNLIQNIIPNKNVPSCKCSHELTEMKYCHNDRPFCCALCTSFKGGFTLCLPYLSCPICFIAICPQCVIMISKNYSDFIESYTSNGSEFYELIRFFYPDHLYEQVGKSSSTAAKIPEFLQKYPYILHMVVDNVGHKPTLYKRYLNSYTEAFSTLEDDKRLIKSSFCWNYLIALKPFQRKTITELKDYKKYSLNKQWNELEEILKDNNICDLIVVIDKESQSALIVDIVESEKEIQNYQMKREVQKTIKETNKHQSNFLELTSKNLPDISFLEGVQNKNEIRVLNLWENKIKNIQLLSQFPKIQELFLRQNQIEEIRPILEMRELQSAFICDNKFKGSLPVLTFPNLTALDISLNEFTDMNNISKSDLKNLGFFRMVNTKITEIPVISLPKLEIFWFDHNDISSLQNLVLSITPELMKVSGTHNNISGQLPRLLFPKLQSLILNYNHITSIQNLEQSSLPNLKSLALHHNSIKGALPFLELKSLTKLDLSYNKISSLPGSLFVNSKFPNLESIDLKFNQISGDFPLIQLKSLRKLDVSNNFIVNIELMGGSKMPSLEFLDMSKNKIKGPLPILRFLKLRRLFLSHNQITDITNLSDSKMPRLAVIKLNSNKINSSIPRMYFQNLRVLELSNNQIIEQQLLSYIHLVPSLQRINLFGNPQELKTNIKNSKNAKGQNLLICFNEVISQ